MLCQCATIANVSHNGCKSIQCKAVHARETGEGHKGAAISGKIYCPLTSPWQSSTVLKWPQCSSVCFVVSKPLLLGRQQHYWNSVVYSASTLSTSPLISQHVHQSEQFNQPKMEREENCQWQGKQSTLKTQHARKTVSVWGCVDTFISVCVCSCAV